MILFNVIIQAAFLIIFVSQGYESSSLEAMKFMHQTTVDPEGDFLISWTPDKDSFIMEMAAKTSGYLAIGFSPNGGMKGSDIFIGWVKDTGEVMGKDTFAKGESSPLIDESQDYEILGGMQNATHTVIRFKRKWDTCDDNDIKLNKDTVRIIWAINDQDPSDDFNWQYHGSNRGVRSMYMKDRTQSKMPRGDDVKIWELKSDNHILPNDDDTYYGCQIFKVPWLTKKHQIIAVS